MTKRNNEVNILVSRKDGWVDLSAKVALGAKSLIEIEKEFFLLETKTNSKMYFFGKGFSIMDVESQRAYLSILDKKICSSTLGKFLGLDPSFSWSMQEPALLTGCFLIDLE